MYEQLTLFQPPASPGRAVYGSGIGQAPALPGRKDSAHMEAICLERLLPLEDYDKIIVLFSGGKDSLARSEISFTAPFPASPKTAPDGKFLRFFKGERTPS